VETERAFSVQRSAINDIKTNRKKRTQRPENQKPKTKSSSLLVFGRECCGEGQRRGDCVSGTETAGGQRRWTSS